MAFVYLGLGTNIGDKVGLLMRQSEFYVSNPWGFDSENKFLNAVVLVETNLSPFDLLAKTQELERNIGRATKSINGYSDRLIDIDILFYDNLIIDQPTLKIPHPHIVERDFVLIPLAEIAPELVHPVVGRKIIDLL